MKPVWMLSMLPMLMAVPAYAGKVAASAALATVLLGAGRAGTGVGLCPQQAGLLRSGTAMGHYPPGGGSVPRAELSGLCRAEGLVRLAARMLDAIDDVKAVIELYNSVPGSGLQLEYAGGYSSGDDIGEPGTRTGTTRRSSLASPTPPTPITRPPRPGRLGDPEDECTRTRAHILFNKGQDWVFGPPEADVVDARHFGTGSNPITFLGILTHEMGHAIGLSHAKDDYATMDQAFKTWFRGSRSHHADTASARRCRRHPRALRHEQRADSSGHLGEPDVVRLLRRSGGLRRRGGGAARGGTRPRRLGSPRGRATGRQRRRGPSRVPEGARRGRAGTGSAEPLRGRRQRQAELQLRGLEPCRSLGRS